MNCEIKSIQDTVCPIFGVNINIDNLFYKKKNIQILQH